MLANELDTARRSLNEAPELQRSRPQLRYRLAQVDFRAGQYQRGLATPGELLDGGAARHDPLSRARLLGSRGALLIRLDRYAGGEDESADCIGMLERHGSTSAPGNASTGRGVARVAEGTGTRGGS